MTTLRRLASTTGGAGFPHTEQGLDTGDLPFVKVSDFNHAGNERVITACTNWVSKDTARRLRAKVVPTGSVLLPKVGAALLGNARRIVGQPSVFDNNILGVVPHNINSRYLHYWLTTVDAAQFAKPGPVPSMDDSAVLNLRVPIVSQPHQRAIAEYLDTETSRIDTLIAKKRRMIALLEERWIAHVASVLTRFDPVPLKRFVTKIGSGSTPRGGADVYVPRGPAFLRSQNIQKGVVDLSDVVFIDRVAQEELRRAFVHTGDVLLNITGGSIGRAAVFDRSDVQAYVSQHVCIVRPAPGVDAGVLCAELSSHSVQDQILVMQVGGNRPGLNFEQVGNLLVRLPPSDESPAIAQELSAGSSHNNQVSETTHAQVDSLKERCQAMIMAAVTDQLTVAVGHNDK